MAPLLADVTVTLAPASMNDAPVDNRVSEPLRPARCVVTPVNEPVPDSWMFDPEMPTVWLVCPVNVVPDTVATTESLMLAVIPVFAPPSTKLMPVPAMRARSALKPELLPTVMKASADDARLGAEMVTAPLLALATLTFDPAMM